MDNKDSLTVILDHIEGKKERDRQERKAWEQKFRQEFGHSSKEVKSLLKELKMYRDRAGQQDPSPAEAALEIQKLRDEIETLKAVDADATDMILETMQPVFDEVDSLAKAYGCTIQELLKHIGTDRQINYFRSNFGR